MTATPQPQELMRSVQLLADINRLSLKAFQSKKLQDLIFLILNDTVAVVRYDRAVLWRLTGYNPTLLGISGQPTVQKHTDLSKQWQAFVKSIEEPGKIQELSFPEIPAGTAILWIPIFAHDKLVAGLWLERWNKVTWRPEEKELLQFLAASYGSAWEKLARRFSLRSIFLSKPWIWFWSLLLLSLFFLRVPLRIVAPMEVVPKNPIVVTAPLEGIVERVVVKPGQEVKKSELLFEYDKRVPLQDLRVAQKKVEIIKAEVDRATAQAQKDKKALAELAVEALKLKKEQLVLQLAEYNATRLNVRAEEAGVAMLDSPEEWEGKPVRVGEKVMVIANPKETMVRMAVPEDDNIVLDLKKPIKVFLNVTPDISRRAYIAYISSFTHVTDKGIPSFTAEADWAEEQDDVKLGLKGTAILYGDDVSVFYWIIRKPWAYVRRFFGF